MIFRFFSSFHVIRHLPQLGPMPGGKQVTVLDTFHIMIVHFTLVTAFIAFRPMCIDGETNRYRKMAAGTAPVGFQCDHWQTILNHKYIHLTLY